MVVFIARLKPCEKEPVQPLSTAAGNEKFHSRFCLPSFSACSGGMVHSWLLWLEPFREFKKKKATLEGCVHPKLVSRYTVEW